MANKSEQSNKIPRVLMISSAAFGVFSAINQYMAIPCAIAGLGANLLNEQATVNTEASERLNKELIEATRKALKATRNEIENSENGSSSQLKIIDELAKEEPQPQTLKALIKKTESFQRYYCTENDSNDIIHLFEKYLGVQIAGIPLLSRYFALSAQSFTVEKIQIISALLDDKAKTIDQIVKLLNSQDAHIKNIEKTGVSIEKRLIFFADMTSQILNEFTRIMLALCVFLVIGIVRSSRYDIVALIVVCCSYGISNLIVASLIKGKYIHEFYFERKNVLKVSLSSVKDFFSVILPLLLPLCCYFLLSYVIILEELTTVSTVISLLPGSIISVFFRAIRQESKSISSKTAASPQKGKKRNRKVE